MFVLSCNLYSVHDQTHEATKKYKFIQTRHSCNVFLTLVNAVLRKMCISKPICVVLNDAIFSSFVQKIIEWKQW